MTSFTKYLIPLLPLFLLAVHLVESQWWMAPRYPWGFYPPFMDPYMFNGNNNNNNGDTNSAANRRDPRCYAFTDCNPRNQAYCPAAGSTSTDPCPQGTVCCPVTRYVGPIWNPQIVNVEGGYSCCVVPQGNSANTQAPPTGSNPSGSGVINGTGSG